MYAILCNFSAKGLSYEVTFDIRFVMMSELKKQFMTNNNIGGWDRVHQQFFIGVGNE